MNIWSVLEIDPSTDIRTVKKAYARKLKTLRPEENPAEFQILRSAYEQALNYAKYQTRIQNQTGSIDSQSMASPQATSSTEEITNNSPKEIEKPDSSEKSTDQHADITPGDDATQRKADPYTEDEHMARLKLDQAIEEIKKRVDSLFGEVKLYQRKNEWQFFSEYPELLEPDIYNEISVYVLKSIAEQNERAGTGKRAIYKTVPKSILAELADFFNWRTDWYWLNDTVGQKLADDIFNTQPASSNANNAKAALNSIRGGKVTHVDQSAYSHSRPKPKAKRTNNSSGGGWGSGFAWLFFLFILVKIFGGLSSNNQPTMNFDPTVFSPSTEQTTLENIIQNTRVPTFSDPDFNDAFVRYEINQRTGYSYLNQDKSPKEYFFEYASNSSDAQRGDARAQTNLGWLYQNGLSTEKDLDKAISWYLRAAEQDDALGQLNLGELYYQGRGIEQDRQEALRWYLSSARLGNAVAQYKTALIYDSGLVSGQNYTRAREWYTKSAEQGNTDAMYNLAIFYDEGLSVNQNKEAAYFLFQAAKIHGGRKADQDIELLIPEIPASRIKQLNDSLAEWSPGEKLPLNI